MTLFESFSTLNRSWEDRVLAHQSERKLFLWLLASLFLFGAVVSVTIYQDFRFHRFDWTDLPVLALLGTYCFRIARIVYRRLGA
jgi:hypothetical protein